MSLEINNKVQLKIILALLIIKNQQKMKTNIKILISVFLIVLVCSSFKNITNNDILETHYYYGEVKVTSPDGKTPYGPVKYSLVKRTIDEKEKTIIEDVRQDGKQFNTKLSQTKEDNVFTATDEDKSFSGTMTFTGDKWKWTNWTYNIEMTNGSGKIVGEGRLTSSAIETIKKFVLPNGKEQVLITEHLNEISKQEYEKLKIN